MSIQLHNLKRAVRNLRTHDSERIVEVARGRVLRATGGNIKDAEDVLKAARIVDEIMYAISTMPDGGYIARTPSPAEQEAIRAKESREVLREVCRELKAVLDKYDRP